MRLRALRSACRTALTVLKDVDKIMHAEVAPLSKPVSEVQAFRIVGRRNDMNSCMGHRGVLVSSPPSTSQPGPSPLSRRRRPRNGPTTTLTATRSDNNTVRRDGSAEARGLRPENLEQPTLREQFDSEPPGACDPRPSPSLLVEQAVIKVPAPRAICASAIEQNAIVYIIEC